LRWIKKREAVIYYLLYFKFGTDQFNVGEALTILSPYFPKRIVMQSITFLSKRGLITRLSHTNFRLVSFEEFMGIEMRSYLDRRATLRRKSQL